MQDDATTQTLFEFPVPEPRVQDVERGEGRVARMMISSPPMFAPPSLWGVLPDGGIAVVDGDAYAIRLLAPDAVTRSILRRPITAREVTREDQEQARARLREQLESGSGAVRITNENGRVSFGGGRRGADMTPGALEARLENLEFAATVPVITGLRTDPLGRLWVQREHGDLFSEGPIDLLTAEGRYLGTIRDLSLPAAVSRSGRAAWIETDELGIEHVVVRTLPSAWMAGAR
jgi:hypothetical protein